MNEEPNKTGVYCPATAVLFIINTDISYFMTKKCCSDFLIMSKVSDNILFLQGTEKQILDMINEINTEAKIFDVSNFTITERED